MSVSSIRTRIVTASDWVPTFPAMSSTRDWKADYNRKYSHNMLKDTYNRGNDHPKEQQDDEPWGDVMLCAVVSLRSSSAVRPASFA